jgi:hypothetical protein
MTSRPRAGRSPEASPRQAVPDATCEHERSVRKAEEPSPRTFAARDPRTRARRPTGTARAAPLAYPMPRPGAEPDQPALAPSGRPERRADRKDDDRDGERGPNPRHADRHLTEAPIESPAARTPRARGPNGPSRSKCRAGLRERRSAQAGVRRYRRDSHRRHRPRSQRQRSPHTTATSSRAPGCWAVFGRLPPTKGQGRRGLAGQTRSPRKLP